MATYPHGLRQLLHLPVYLLSIPHWLVRQRRHLAHKVGRHLDQVPNLATSMEQSHTVASHMLF